MVVAVVWVGVGVMIYVCLILWSGLGFVLIIYACLVLCWSVVGMVLFPCIILGVVTPGLVGFVVCFGFPFLDQLVLEVEAFDDH